jgi:hypothetical protein
VAAIAVTPRAVCFHSSSTGSYTSWVIGPC